MTVHWCQVTKGDVILDQRMGARFIGDPGRVKASMLSNGRVTAGVRDDFTWFVGHADVDLGVGTQRIVRLRRWAQGCASLLTGARGHAEVLVVEAEDGDRLSRFELAMDDDGRTVLTAHQLDDDGRAVRSTEVRLA